jgi:hypothetical protein
MDELGSNDSNDPRTSVESNHPMPAQFYRALLLVLLCGVAGISQDPLAIARAWIPTAIGDRWIYEEDVRDGDRQHSDIERWRQDVLIVAIDTIPEGILIRRKVTYLDDTRPPRRLQSSGESNILVRNDCAWYLTRFGWDQPHHQLGGEFRKALLAGEMLPDVCFPLKAGKTWGDPQKGRVFGQLPARGPRTPTIPLP